MTGASLSGVMVTVVVCVAHCSGVPPSQTCTETSQLAGGVGPAGVKAYAPVPALMVPPHVSAGPMDHVAPGPSGSDAVALYVYATSSVAVVAAVLVMTGASLSSVMVSVSASELLRGSGSVNPAGVATLATLISRPIPITVALIVKVTRVPTGRSTVASMSPLPDAVPHAAAPTAAHVQVMEVSSGGKKSVTLAPMTGSGPEVVTVTV